MCLCVASMGSDSDGRSVLIIGAGITGLLHIQAARINGAGFIAVSDMNPDRLKLAMKFGVMQPFLQLPMFPLNLKD